MPRPRRAIARASSWRPIICRCAPTSACRWRSRDSRRKRSRSSRRWPTAAAADGRVRQNLAFAYAMNGDLENCLLVSRKDLDEQSAQRQLSYFMQLRSLPVEARSAELRRNPNFFPQVGRWRLESRRGCHAAVFGTALFGIPGLPRRIDDGSGGARPGAAQQASTCRRAGRAGIPRPQDRPDLDAAQCRPAERPADAGRPRIRSAGPGRLCPGRGRATAEHRAAGRPCRSPPARRFRSSISATPRSAPCPASAGRSCSTSQQQRRRRGAGDQLPVHQRGQPGRADARAGAGGRSPACASA